MNSLATALKTFSAVLALALCLVGCDGAGDKAAEGEQTGAIREKTEGDSVAVEVNSLAPAFAGKVLGGGEVRLTDYIETNVVLLEFWSIFCKSCLEEMPAIKELHRRYGDKGLSILSINTDVFSDAKVLKVLRKAGLDFGYPILRDKRQEISKAFNVELLPVTVIIDKSGWIRYYQEGYRPGDEEDFEDVIRSLLDDEGADDVTLDSRGGVTSFAPAGSTPASGEALAGPVSAGILGGESVTLGDGRPSVLFFWSLYCKPCRAEFPQVAGLEERLAGKDIDVYSVNVDSEKLGPRVRKFAQAHPGLTCITDWEGAVPGPTLAKRFGVVATPTVLVLDGSGGVVFAEEGLVDVHDLEGKLDELVFHGK